MKSVSTAYPEFPPPQLYILLAASVTLLGVIVSNLSSSTRNLKGADLVFLLAWLHLTLSLVEMVFRVDMPFKWLWFYTVPHLLAMLLLLYGFKMGARVVKDRVIEETLE